MSLCLLLFVTPYFWPNASEDSATDFSDFKAAVANWQGANESEEKVSDASSSVVSSRPIPFDPNSPSRENLAALQLSERAIRAWLSYTSKGGSFRQAADLDKFRALTDAERARVRPYLLFPEAEQKAVVDAALPETIEHLALQPFDPNQITKEELIAFGLPAKAAATWTKFLEAGGSFRKAEDIGKLYTLPPEWRDKLIPFVQITNTETPSVPPSNSRPTMKSDASIIIDINQASVEEWQQLYGIGPALSNRIVNFRNKLGGFHVISQVAETYGLPDSTFQHIRPKLRVSAILQPIYINQTTEKELAAHPYIHRLSAQLIANYRREHGPFQSLEDLDKLYGLEEGLVEKLKPYLVFE